MLQRVTAAVAAGGERGIGPELSPPPRGAGNWDTASYTARGNEVFLGWCGSSEASLEACRGGEQGPARRGWLGSSRRMCVSCTCAHSGCGV